MLLIISVGRCPTELVDLLFIFRHFSLKQKAKILRIISVGKRPAELVDFIFHFSPYNFFKTSPFFTFLIVPYFSNSLRLNFLVLPTMA